jgi:hypothetical protein
MNVTRMRMAVLLASAMLAALLLPPGMARAEATKTPVAGEIVGADTLVPFERVWFDEEGILHIRGQHLGEYLTGDLAGILYTDADFNLDLVTGDGELYGFFTLVDLEGNAIFEGRFTGIVTGWYFDGTWTAHGVGACEGQKLFVDNYGSMVDLPQVYVGIILDPHGE